MKYELIRSAYEYVRKLRTAHLMDDKTEQL